MNFDIKAERSAGRRLGHRAHRRGRPLHRAGVQAAAPRRRSAQGAKHVVVDLTDTTFIDSTTLGVLVGGVKRLRPRGRPALDRLQRPQHHQDLRDHRAEPGLPDPRRQGRGARERRRHRGAAGSRAVTCRLVAILLAAVALSRRRAAAARRRRRATTAPTARTARSSSSRAPTATPSCGSCHTLAGRGHGRDGRAQPRPGARLQLRAGLRGGHGLLGRPRPDRPRPGSDARRPRHGPGRGRRGGLRRERRRQGRPRLRPERRPGAPPRPPAPRRPRRRAARGALRARPRRRGRRCCCRSTRRRPRAAPWP